MLDTRNKTLSNLQKHIDSVVTGHCLLVKLVNYDELSSISEQADEVMLSLYKIVQDICNSKILFSQLAKDKIILILPLTDKIELRRAIHQIYCSSQLYLNHDIRMVYINCTIASVDFPSCSNDARLLYNLLISRISSFTEHHYFYEYDHDKHNLNKIVEDNLKLNLLRDAIKNKKLKFAYQAVINATTSDVVYHECLLRFPSYNESLVTIASVMHLIEDKGLMSLIDYMVIEMVIEELIATPDIKLSVNISNIALTDDYFLYITKTLLTNNNVANRLIIEITETTISQDYLKTKAFMEELNNIGCMFALDDFGTGFTSFKQLKELPIDIIKIDGSYIKDIIEDNASKYFVEALIKMAGELGIKTVAEFVENGTIAKFLIDRKIDCLQGNFLSPASHKR